MRTLPRLISALALSCSLAACPQPSDSDPKLVANPAGEALPFNHPPVAVPEPEANGRKTRRLSVQQLRATLPVILGNDLNGKPIAWRIGAQEGLTTFSTALGEADYLNVTDEDLEPSPMYVKFIDDLARDVCNQALVADLTRTDKADRVLLRHVEKDDTLLSNPAGVRENLRYLKLRFHGVKLAPDETSSLARLEALFSRAPAVENWRLVCVALVTAPEFHLY